MIGKWPALKYISDIHRTFLFLFFILNWADGARGLFVGMRLGLVWILNQSRPSMMEKGKITNVLLLHCIYMMVSPVSYEFWMMHIPYAHGEKHHVLYLFSSLWNDTSEVKNVFALGRRKSRRINLLFFTTLYYAHNSCTM